MGTPKNRSRLKGQSLSLTTGNKLKRQELFVGHKQSSERQRREDRLRRRKQEDASPDLRKQRLQNNVPASIDKKRIWDDVDDDGLGAVVDVAQLKRRRLESESVDKLIPQGPILPRDRRDGEDDLGSMLGSDDESEDGKDGVDERCREPSIAPSTTSTNLDLTPASLAQRFPSLFGTDEAHPTPKILVTTTLNSTLHHHAALLCNLFPNSYYVPRSRHRYGHKYSLRDISKFATNRGYSSVIVLREDQKQPSGLDIVHLPSGPTLQFSISNFVDGKKLPGHGNPTGHYPELLLNNFKTPLGLLTAKVFQTLFPAQSEVVGRTVVSISNQRDVLFLNRHRYVFREKRITEKPAVSADGKEIPGGVRVGLQILGPKIHMKLRRVYGGIGRAGSEGVDGVMWEWKSSLEKTRTRFYL